MALTNFYKGPEAEYSSSKHGNGIYISTDSNKLWVFGQLTREFSDIMSKSDYDMISKKDPNLTYIVKLSE